MRALNIIIVSSLLGACAQNAYAPTPLPERLRQGITINSSRADGFDPGKIGTYTLPLSVGAVADPTRAWANPKFDVMTELEYQVHEQMHAMGALPSSQKPDVLVLAAVVVDTTVEWQIEALYGEDQTPPDIETGALLVQFISPDSGHVLWTATATGPTRASESDWTDAEAAQRLRWILEQMFQRLDASSASAAATQG